MHGFACAPTRAGVFLSEQRFEGAAAVTIAAASDAATIPARELSAAEIVAGVVQRYAADRKIDAHSLVQALASLSADADALRARLDAGGYRAPVSREPVTEAADPVGRGIAWRKQADRFGNHVSIAGLAVGTKFRIVHHTEPLRSKQHAAAYARPGKFVRISSYVSPVANRESWIRVGGYHVVWLAGKVCKVEMRDGGPDIGGSLRAIENDNFDEVVLHVLEAIRSVADCWETKEPGQPAPAPAPPV
jgi:hypothetical protein